MFDVLIIVLAVIEYKHVEKYRSLENQHITPQQPTYQAPVQPVQQPIIKSQPPKVSEEKSRFCPNCGAPAKGELCPKCGNKID